MKRKIPGSLLTAVLITAGLGGIGGGSFLLGYHAGSGAFALAAGLVSYWLGLYRVKKRRDAVKGKQ